MSASASHRVRRLAWQVRARSPAAALSARARLLTASEAVPALLAPMLDAAAPGDVLVKIPRLQVTLQVRDGDDLEAEFLPRLVEALQVALEGAMAAAAEDDRASALRVPAGELPGPKPGFGSTALQRTTWATSVQTAFAYYLAWGDLPWPQQTLSPEVQQALLGEAALGALQSAGGPSHSVQALAPRLLTLLPAEPQRWPGAFARWLACLPPDVAHAWTKSAAQELHARGSMTAPHGERAQLLAAAFWAFTRPGQPIDTTSAALGQVQVPRGLDPARPREADGYSAISAPPDAAPGAGSVREPGPEPRVDRTEGAAQGPRPLPHSMPAIGPRAESDLVSLAGLVLLHPFLPRLLAACRLVDASGSQVPDAALPRACALLHALAAGPMPAREHALPLVKLLLGRRPGTPLDTELPALEPTDLVEAQGLLEAVRTHWSALGRTGPDALRVSFLQRRGVLSRRDGTWSLHMEREPFDLLLGLLPWGIGFVRLPWMPAPLIVEWQAS